MDPTPDDKTSTFEICSGEISDLARLTVLFSDFKRYAQSKGHIYDQLSPKSELAIEEILSHAIAKPETVCLVARENALICGFLLAYEETLPSFYKVNKIGHVTDLFVAEPYRCTGIGTALLKAAEQAFAIRRIDHIRLETTVVNSENKLFYESLGFEMFIYELRKRTTP